MAKPITSSKRDNEKKKHEKRIEKQKKKDVRKQNTASSFDDMIAYVDENGQISSTPPVKTDASKPSFKLPAIQTPKQNFKEMTGRIEHLNDEKNYGFIKETGTVNKYFFHVSSLVDNAKIGDNVTFDLERGKKGMNAVNVKSKS